MQGLLDDPNTKGRYYHLFLNGVYWGVYETEERAGADYAESYLGGESDDYDVVKPDSRTYVVDATDGTMDAFNTLWETNKTFYALNNTARNTDEELGTAVYYALQGKTYSLSDEKANSIYQGDVTYKEYLDGLPTLLNVQNLCDYMIMTYYFDITDGGSSFSNSKTNNYQAIYNRLTEDGFYYILHDNEHALGLQYGSDTKMLDNSFYSFANCLNSLLSDATSFNPGYLHESLMANVADYRTAFADRVYELMYNGGILEEEKVKSYWDTIQDSMGTAMVGESIRWGSTSLTLTTWENACSTREKVLDGRVTKVISNLREVISYTGSKTGSITYEGLAYYPSIDPPTFNEANTFDTTELKNFAAPTTDGGAGDMRLYQLSEGMENLFSSVGTGLKVYYTLDGTDPRASGGAPAGTEYVAGESETAIQAAVEDSALISVRAYNETTNEWSALTYATVYAENLAVVADTVVINEVLTGSNLGVADYIELYNPTADTIDISGCILLDSGIYLPTGGIVAKKIEDIYQFGSGTTLAAGQTILATSLEFGLSGDGEPIYLMIPDTNGAITIDGLGTFTLQETVNVPAMDKDSSYSRIPDGNILADASGQGNSGSFTITTYPTPDETNLANLADSLRVTEVNYNPTDNPNSEFIEIYNASATQVMDLSGVVLVSNKDAFTYTIADSTTLNPGEFAVLVYSQTGFEAVYGTGIKIVGAYGTVDGERKAIELKKNGVTISFYASADVYASAQAGESGAAAFYSLTYGNKAANGWPTDPDGEGYSLELWDAENGFSAAIVQTLDQNSSANWRASILPGGTPGKAPEAKPEASTLPKTIVLNELLTTQAAGEELTNPDYIELVNPGAESLDISGWLIADSGIFNGYGFFASETGNAYRFSEGTTIDAGGYQLVRQSVETETGSGLYTDGFKFGLSNSGDGSEIVYLFKPDEAGAFSMADGTTWTLVDSAAISVAMTAGQSYSLKPDGSLAGNFIVVDNPTPGEQNFVSVEDCLKITEIYYNPSEIAAWETPIGTKAKEYKEYIEIYNSSSSALLDLSGIVIDPVGCTIADSTLLGPGEYAVIVRSESAFAERFGSTWTDSEGVERPIRVIGTYSSFLGNKSNTISVYASANAKTAGTALYSFTVYDGSEEGYEAWPTEPDGNGSSLELVTSNLDPALAASWQASWKVGGTPGRGLEAAPTLGAPAKTVVVNEIMTTQADKTADPDFVELYNPGTDALDISGWLLVDSGIFNGYEFVSGCLGDIYTIPAETTIAAGGFWSVKQSVEDGDGGFAFGLGNGGESVYLFKPDESGAYQYTVITSTEEGSAAVSTTYRFTLVDKVVDIPEMNAGQSYNLAPDGNKTGVFATLNATTLDRQNFASLAGNLAVTEIYYNPSKATGTETQTAKDAENNYEYLEFYNSSTATLDLSGVVFKTVTNKNKEQIDFTFAAGTYLAPGEYAVLVKNQTAFAERFGTTYVDASGTVQTIQILGEFNEAGFLHNKTADMYFYLSTADALNTNNAFLSFTYRDGSEEGYEAWPTEPDGGGWSLELVDQTAAAPAYNSATSWRASYVYGGTPGRAGYVPVHSGVIVNEVLTHTDAPDIDYIELYNTTDTAIDLTGWFLTDELEEGLQFAIPAGTTIDAGGYLTFYQYSGYKTEEGEEDEEEDEETGIVGENNFGFGLSQKGDSVYIIATDSITGDRYLCGQVTFGASANGLALGRWGYDDASLAADQEREAQYLENGAWTLLPMIQTPGSENAAPYVGVYNPADTEAGKIIGSVLINEIMYQPVLKDGETESKLEYVELYNYSDVAVNLENWKIGQSAVSAENYLYSFGSGVTLAPGETILLVEFDPTDADALAAFAERYGLGSESLTDGTLAAGTNVFQAAGLSLSNSGGLLSVFYPHADEEAAGGFLYFLSDQVAYETATPWPILAAGQGASLNRVKESETDPGFGNNPSSWKSGSPSPQALDVSSLVQISVVVPETPSDSDSTEIPQSVTQLNEWDSFTAEIWLSGQTFSELPLSELQFQIQFDPNLYQVVLPEEVSQDSRSRFAISDSDPSILIGTIVLSESELETGLIVPAIGSLLLGSVTLTPIEHDDSHTGLILNESLASPLSVSSVEAAAVATDGTSEKLTPAVSESQTTVRDIPYDLTRDGLVKMDDFIQFAQVFNQYTSQEELESSTLSDEMKTNALAADFDNNGKVDMNDFIYFAQNFNKKMGDTIIWPESASAAASASSSESASESAESAELIAMVAQPDTAPITATESVLQADADADAKTALASSPLTDAADQAIVELLNEQPETQTSQSEDRGTSVPVNTSERPLRIAGPAPLNRTTVDWYWQQKKEKNGWRVWE